MSFAFNFGRIQVAASKGAAVGDGRFRLALLGDFSARAQRGELERGEALAQRKPIRIDCDNFDKVLQRLQVKLALQMAGGSVDISIGSLDDFHPEQLFENLEIFSELSSLRQRLKTPSSFAKAAAELQQWTGETFAAPNAGPARGSVVQAAGELSDFALLVGQSSAAPRTGTPVEDLLRQIVGPYVIASKDPRQESMIASVDEALSAAMRSVLHHPDFQALEALWRSVDMLVRRLETGRALEIVLIDLTAEELAAELSGSEALESCGLYRWLVEQPALDASQGAYSALIASYTFARTPAHAELLGRFAKVASAIPAAVATGMAPSLLEENPKDLPAELTAAWTALGELPEAGYLALLTPAFLLRQPYGRRSDPVDCFDFEEITPKTGLRGFLWGNPAVLAGLLLGETSTEQGRKMTPGARLSVGDLPFYYFTDTHGDQEALPCTEKLVTSREAALATSQGFIPVVSLKGSPEVRLGGFHSITGKVLAGPWAPLVITAPPPPAQVAAAVPAEQAPVAAAAEGSGDAELDALLAGLDAPAEPAPFAVKVPTPEIAEPAVKSSGDAELDALLAGLDAPAEPVSPVVEAPTPEIAEPAIESSDDAELDAMLAGLDAPVEPASLAAEAPVPEIEAAEAIQDEPVSETAEAADEDVEAPDSTGDSELDALLASLAPDAPAAVSSVETAAGDLDPALAELLNSL